MGHRSRIRQQRRAEIIHRTKLFGGKMTAQEVHGRWGIKIPCFACGKMPVILIRSMIHHDEFVKRDEQLAVAIASSNPAGPFIPTIPTTYGPMVMVSRVSACKEHQREAERAAAKSPSWYLVEIDRGPGADKAQIQVPTMLDRMHNTVLGGG